MNDSVFYVTDENGESKQMQILFTFMDERSEKNYVVFVDPSDEESDEIFASGYASDGSLIPIETDEEWEMVNEVLAAFDEDMEAEANEAEFDCE
jgi:uncharacterized protein YrzB (UPF0473 family)